MANLAYQVTNFAYQGAGQFSYQGSTDVAPSIPIGGSGYPVDWQGKRRKLSLKEQPDKHLRHILDRVISEYYAEVVNADGVSQEAKKEVAQVVKPYADKKGRFKAVPAAAQIDWAALESNASAVSAILQIWSEEVKKNDIDDDDDTMMMLMH